MSDVGHLGTDRGFHDAQPLTRAIYSMSWGQCAVETHSHFTSPVHAIHQKQKQEKEVYPQTFLVRLASPVFYIWYMYFSVTLTMWLRSENRKVHEIVIDCLLVKLRVTCSVMSKIYMHITKITRGPLPMSAFWYLVIVGRVSAHDQAHNYSTTIIIMVLEWRVTPHP